MYGVIYEAINKTNNKRYIGQTTQKIENRINHHKIVSKNNTRAFYCAIRKYGWDNFEWKTIDYAENSDELNSKEMFWILFFNAHKKGGYNMTIGGQYSKDDVLKKYGRCSNTMNIRQEKEFMVFDKQGIYIKTTKNIAAFAEEIKALPSNVGLVLKNKKNSVGEYILFYEDEFTQEKLNKHIKQLRNTNEFTVFDYKTGMCLGVWSNFTRCNEDTGFSRRMMERQLIEGIKTHARKFIIKYLNDCNENELDRVNTYQLEKLSA